MANGESATFPVAVPVPVADLVPVPVPVPTPVAVPGPLVEETIDSLIQMLLVSLPPRARRWMR